MQTVMFTSIALDFDGVISDQESKKIRVLKEEYGLSGDLSRSLDKLQLLKYSLQDYLVLSNSEYESLQNKFFDDLSDVTPVKGALDGIHYLSDLGYNLHIVTYRKERLEIPKWLKRYNLDLTVVYPKLGDQVPNVDYMLDDTPSKLATLEQSVAIQSYLLSSPKNQECRDMHGRFIRVGDWTDFLSKLEYQNLNLSKAKYS